LRKPPGQAGAERQEGIMPIIDHSDLSWAATAERVRERHLVSRQQGAVSLTIKEVEIAPRWENRLHTHLEFPNPWDGRGYGNNMVFPLDVVVGDR
jgi:hypothetical protein